MFGSFKRQHICSLITVLKAFYKLRHPKAHKSSQLKFSIHQFFIFDLFMSFSLKRQSVSLIYNNSTISMEGKDFKSKYETLNLLGQGSFGSVYRVKAKDGSKQPNYYVAKKIFLEGISEEQLKFAYGEITILEKINQEINSSSVIAYKEFFKTQKELIIIMQYCQSGDLTGFLKTLKANNQRLEEKIIAFWFTQILLGLKALHSKRILHRDLKSANVFLTHDYHVKIGDFGISKILERSTAITCIGSPLYLSPEVCNNEPYGMSSDIWALGCILYQLCTQNYPFKASNLIILAKMITCDEVQPLPAYYSRQLNDILLKMFVKDKKKRITLDQILKTPYIARTMEELKAFSGDFSELAKPISSSLPQQPRMTVDFDEDDTMKTIGSIVEKTSEKELQFSGYQRKTLREQVEVSQLNESAKLSTQLKKNQSKLTADQTGSFSRSTFKNKSVHGGKVSPQANKMQTMNVKKLSSEIQGLTIRDNDEDFEEVEFAQVKPRKQKQLGIRQKGGVCNTHR